MLQNEALRILQRLWVCYEKGAIPFLTWSRYDVWIRAEFEYWGELVV